jgi:hypothetical protein
LGGGNTTREEVAKRIRQFIRRDGGGQGESAPAIEELHLCEKPQTVSFRATSRVAAGTEIRVMRADPPAVIADGVQIGAVSNRQQAATLNACLDDGYAISGSVVTFDQDLGEGLATVVGVR